MDNIGQYGFLGPIVGIAGILISAGTAILFGWTRTFSAWKPPQDVLPEPLSRMVTLLCALGVCMAWIFAEPARQPQYITAIWWLAGGSVIAFLLYVALRSYCGQFLKPLVGADNKPNGHEVVWGGFWKTPQARQAVRDGATLEDFLAGNQYKKAKAWPPLSLLASALVTAVALLGALAMGTTSLSTAAATIQVALTNKPARAVFSSDEVPGLPPSR